MKISNSTGKSKDFYNRGKAMFDQIPPVTQAVTQIPQKHSSKRMTVFELIEVNGLTLHGDIEHFAALVAAAERERIIAANAPEIEKTNAHIKMLEDEIAVIRRGNA
jgi:hypothetical protein